MCFILNNSYDSKNSVFLDGLSIINLSILNPLEKKFICFAYVYNIDVINRKIILVSNKLRSIIHNDCIFKIILFRNNSTLDKNINVIKDSQTLENILIEKSLPSSKINIFSQEEYNDKCQLIDKSFYSTNNKYSII
jgi:hypothetical protein